MPSNSGPHARSRPILTALAVALLAAAPGAVAAQTTQPAEPPPEQRAAQADPLRTITVTGVGPASSRPTQAHVTVGVVSEAAQAQAALSANNSAMSTLLATVESFGVEGRDVQTRNFNVSPVYEQRPGRAEGAPRIAGYRVSNEVMVRVRDLPRLGELLDKVVADGANRINGIGFDIADSSKVDEQARRSAVADARSRAETYAAAAGVALGRVLAIAEQGAAAPPQPMRLAAMERSMAADVPIAEGELEVRATVTVVYAIAP